MFLCATNRAKKENHLWGYSKIKEIKMWKYALQLFVMSFLLVFIFPYFQTPNHIRRHDMMHFFTATQSSQEVCSPLLSLSAVCGY